MYIAPMGLMCFGHIGNIINIDHVGNDSRNLDDEFRIGAGVIFFTVMANMLLQSSPSSWAASIKLETSFASPK